jgi:hypothetical protein
MISQNIDLSSWDTLYSFRYYPLFHITAVGLGTYHVGSNQQSQYSVFHELMCWQSLTFRLSNVISPLQRGDLVYHVTGRMMGLKPKFY